MGGKCSCLPLSLNTSLLVLPFASRYASHVCIAICLPFVSQFFGRIFVVGVTGMFPRKVWRTDNAGDGTELLNMYRFALADVMSFDPQHV